MAEEPDYIFKDKNHPNTAIASKSLPIDGQNVNLVIRLAVETDDPALENSIITAILENDKRDIWAAYYHPVFADVFDSAGFLLKDELRDKTRDTTTRFYCYPKR